MFAGTIDFSKLGIPQRRARVIIIGIRKDLAGDLDALTRIRSLFERALSGRKRLFYKLA
jgi:C-5 cytosine-specific DNA methylase.